MADVAAVAVAVEEDELRARGISGGGIKPAVEFEAVAGLEKDVFERTAELRAGSLQLARGVIYAAFFEPAEQHWPYDAILGARWREGDIVKRDA